VVQATKDIPLVVDGPELAEAAHAVLGRSRVQALAQALA
jgi:hypothetical protein